MAISHRDLVILVPVLGRPHRVEPLLESARAATPEARVLFIPDPHDGEEIAALDAAGAQWTSCAGNYAAKINYAVDQTDEPLILMGADDLAFHPYWFFYATAALLCEVQARAAGLADVAPGFPVEPWVVGTNDMGNQRVLAGEHATHCLVHRNYVALGTIDCPGKLLHEGYPHEFVDDEFVETARARGHYVHAHHARVEHLHPLWGKAPTDALYDAQRHRMRVGRRIYLERRHLWSSS